MRITILTIAVLICFSLNATEILMHPTCDIILSAKKLKNLDFLSAELPILLKKYGYTAKEHTKGMPIAKNSIYIELSRKIDGVLYAPCSINLKIKKTRETYFSSADKIIYKKKTTRRVPRTTLKGKIRCYKALRDSMQYMPKCQHSKTIPRA